MRKTFFSQTAVFCGLCSLFLAVSANKLFAGYTETVNVTWPSSYYNGSGQGAYDSVGTANVSGSYYDRLGYFYNGYNYGTGTVDTVNNSGYGHFYNGYNYGTGTVDTVNNSGSGYFYNGYNYGTGTVDTVNNSGYGTFCNGMYSDIGIVNTVNIVNNSGYGRFFNGYSCTGIVITVTLNGGEFHNGYCKGTGTVNTVTLNGGTFYNAAYDDSTGNIGHLIYNGGSYQANVNYYDRRDARGSKSSIDKRQCSLKDTNKFLLILLKNSGIR